MKKPTIQQTAIIAIGMIILAFFVITWRLYSHNKKENNISATEFDASLKGNEIVKEIHYTKCCMLQIDIVTKVGESTRNGLFTYIEYNEDGTIKTETVTEHDFKDIGKTATEYGEYCKEYHYTY